MPVHSRTLKINGVCDVVEFVKDDSGIEINNVEGLFLLILLNINEVSQKE